MTEPFLALLARAELAAAEAKVRVLEEAAAEARANKRTWTDQAQSPLGRRRHCAAVRRLVAEGSAGAAVVGRRHLLSTQALDDELARASSRLRPDRSRSVADGLRAELRLVRRRK